MKHVSVIVPLLASAAMLFTGCGKSPVSFQDSADNYATGKVQVMVKLGKIGSLAKAAEISLDTLMLDLSATGEASIHQDIALSGHDQQTVNTTIELAAGKTWTLSARTVDDINPWQSVHSGSTTFSVVEGNNPAVTLNLDAAYSMLVVRINPVPDSSTYMALSFGDSTNNFWAIDDTTYTKGAKPVTDTVKLYYDWLSVSSWEQKIQVMIRGTWEGSENVALYWGTLNIPAVVAGQDAGYSFNLNWIGPSKTNGQKPIAVTIGKVGVITVDGKPVIQ
jgi:hypothetical protein